MTLQQLTYVLALDTYRHYVNAAEKCFVTQPTLTIQIKKLEDEIGFTIFDKSRSPFIPTSLGELFIAKTKRVLSEVDELKNMIISEQGSLAGKYIIGVIPTISPYLIPLISGDFSSKFPEIQLEIVEMQTQDIINGLQRKELDIGLLVSPLDEPFIREIKLYNEPFVFYGQKSENLKNKTLISSKEIDKMEDLWLLSSGHCFRNQVLNICSTNKSNKNIQFQSGSIEALKKMVDNYGGFTLIPEMAVNHKDEGQYIHFDLPKPTREVSIVVHHTFAKDSLIDALRHEILAKTPQEFVKNNRFMRINWR